MSAIVGYHWLIPLLAAGANVTICILVLRLGMRERLHRGFAALTLTSTSWNLGIFSLCFFRDPVAAEWASAFVMTFSSSGSQAAFGGDGKPAWCAGPPTSPHAV